MLEHNTNCSLILSYLTVRNTNLLMSCISRKEIREFIGIYRKEISESEGD